MPSDSLDQTIDKVQAFCDRKAFEIISSVADIPEMLRLVVLCGVLSATAAALGIDREKVIAALNSIFDDIEKGEIPGQIPSDKR